MSLVGLLSGLIAEFFAAASLKVVVLLMNDTCYETEKAFLFCQKAKIHKIHRHFVQLAKTNLKRTRE